MVEAGALVLETYLSIADRALLRERIEAAGGRVLAASLALAPGLLLDDVTDTEGNVFALTERTT